MLDGIGPTNTYLDWTPTGLVTLTHISDDDDLDSLVLKFLPANAHRLAQMLITASEAAWDIQQEMEQERTP
jgi:hypothetical protein